MPSLSSSRASSAERVAAAAAELGRGDVERDRDLLAGREAGALDRRDERRRAPPRWWRSPATSRLRRRRRGASRAPAISSAGGAVDLGRPFERLGEVARARADDHEVLDVDAPAGVRAAAEDLDLRQRQQRRRVAAEVPVQRHAARRGRRVRRRHRHRERRVGAEPRLVRRAVELDQPARRARAWSAAVMPASARGDLAVDVRRPRAARRGRRSAAPPSRRSSASRDPVEAPAGAIARPIAPPSSATSASTVGRPRLSQTRRAWIAGDVGVAFMSPMSRAQARAHGRRAASTGRRAAARRATRAHDVARRRRSVMYSTGDLPSTRASSSPGSSARRAPRARRAAPSRRRRGRPPRAASKHARKAPRRRRSPQAFQQQVVEAEREVERRVAPPGAFGIEEHRAVAGRPGCSSG